MNLRLHLLALLLLPSTLACSTKDTTYSAEPVDPIDDLAAAATSDSIIGSAGGKFQLAEISFGGGVLFGLEQGTGQLLRYQEQGDYWQPIYGASAAGLTVEADGLPLISGVNIFKGNLGGGFDWIPGAGNSIASAPRPGSNVDDRILAGWDIYQWNPGTQWWDSLGASGIVRASVGYHSVCAVGNNDRLFYRSTLTSPSPYGWIAFPSLGRDCQIDPVTGAFYMVGQSGLIQVWDGSAWNSTGRFGKRIAPHNRDFFYIDNGGTVRHSRNEEADDDDEEGECEPCSPPPPSTPCESHPKDHHGCGPGPNGEIDWHFHSFSVHQAPYPKCTCSTNRHWACC